MIDGAGESVRHDIGVRLGAHPGLVRAAAPGRAGTPFSWIVNVADGSIEVHSDPTGPDPTPGDRPLATVASGGRVRFCVPGQPVVLIPARDRLPETPQVE